MLPRTFLRRELITLLGATLLTGALQSSAHAETRDWYDVEVVIFRQHDSGNVQSDERWPISPGPAKFERYARISPDVSVDVTVPKDDEQQESAVTDDLVFRELPEEALGLRDTARRLRNSSTYEVLLHTAWQQPGFPGATAPAIALPLDSEPPVPEPRFPVDPTLQATFESLPPLPSGLSGYIRVVRERYLHFEADLRLPLEGEYLATDEAMRGAIPLFGEDANPVVVMQDRRRMRSGELHYLDNPRLGILVQVRVAER